MSKARERRKKRQQREAMARKVTSQTHQVLDANRVTVPSVRIPFGRWLLLIPGAIILFVVVILGLRFINPPEAQTAANAIWLDGTWTHTQPSTTDLQALVIELENHQIGRVFAYASSLKSDNTWSGMPERLNRFTEVEANLTSFAEQFATLAPEIELYAWIEVPANNAEGYRLDNLQVQNTIASFANRMLTRTGFDGVMLDIKPIFDENDGYLSVLRSTRATIGLDTPLAVAVPPDLSPSGTELVVAPQIAPGTEWSLEYKQRVALQADVIVVHAYNSYLTRPIDYINWVTHQVDAYTDALNDLDTGATILMSVPNYAASLPAHNPGVESLSAALDGVRRGLTFRTEDDVEQIDLSFVSGVAIFTDAPLGAEEWRIFEQKWSQG